MPLRLLAVALSLLLSVCFLGLVAYKFSRDTLEHQWERGRAVIDHGAHWSAEAVSFIDFAEGIDAPACSDAMLTALRTRLFQHEYIKDAGYLDNGHLLCTTTLGRSVEPMPITEPDYLSSTGYNIWINEPLALSPNARGFIIQKGHFNTVFLLESLPTDFPPGIRWQAVYRSENLTETIVGQPGIYRGLPNDRRFSVTVNHHYAEYCSDVIPYCIGVESNHWRMLNEHRWLVALVLLATLGVFAGTYWLLDSRLRQYNSLGNRVRRGLERGRFHFLYQPIVDLNTGGIVGCEVLARFEDPLGPLTPGEFIPEIERRDLTWPFTEKVIYNAFTDLETQRDLPDGFGVNINFFPQDLYEDLSRNLPYILPLKSTRFRMVVEVTEDKHLDANSARNTLAWLGDSGYDVAIDDFGTGYSNLDKLHQVNCQTIKIDRSFVSDIEEGGIKSTFIAYMVQIARELDVKIVAEGVETALQEKELVQLGVHFAQGWRFGKPMNAEALARVVACSTGSNAPVSAGH
ncbi:EAL domain-containing protein [Saccharospirillum salsuginis]|uniref:cyclic-guanylate-specific phosphodiesterase n=1 Tax=Saccharospirillum salsuginis TaxID=418750 RepID=A0A918KDD4_9GAMM|nr:EAL domain-containing protein [Saccharospirillum salsuginis]GGX57890.1 cyclic diguanylate phosphodiesterase [Saccharospirillum salsuginis]